MSYNKTTWQNGDVITSQKLNNIEGGVSNLSNDYEPTIWQNGDIITAQKLNNIENQLDRLDDIWSGGGSGEDYFTALLKGELNEVSDNEVKNIAPGCFIGNQTLLSVSFNACATIGEYAFNGCASLTSVNFPVCTSIGGNAFDTCTSLTSVSFPACTSIGAWAFYDCSSLTSVGFPACTSVGDLAFYSCSSLRSANFPKCTYIGSSAFYGCTSLSRLYLASESVVSIDSDILNNTPMVDHSCLGYFGSIYVPASLIDSYKSADYWRFYVERFVAIEQYIFT